MLGTETHKQFGFHFQIVNNWIDRATVLTIKIIPHHSR